MTKDIHDTKKDIHDTKKKIKPDEFGTMSKIMG